MKYLSTTILLLSLTGSAPGQTHLPKQPNLLLFMADDMTYTDLGCTGNPDVRTPHIDRLAREGIRFTRCYSPAPTCSPLRQSLFTGLYPVRNGAHPNHSQVYDKVRSLAHYLRPLGYRTAIVGKRHEAPASAFPFEMLGGSHGDSGKTPAGTDLPLNRARDFMAAGAQQPWCLMVTSNQPHTPWNRGDASAYPPQQLTVPPYLVDTPQLRDGLSRYYAEITYMDAQVGRLLTDLKSLKQDDNTVVVWLSEQGSQLPFGKWTCYDTGIHAAAIVRWPDVIPGGRISDALLSYVDVLPTLVELAGGEVASPEVDGHSFVPVLTRQAATHNRVVFSTHTTRGIARGSDAFGIRAATDGRWLYIRNLHAAENFQNVITAKDPIFASWKQIATPFARARVQNYIRRPAHELFDLKHDPWCQANLADVKNAAADAAQSRLSGRLRDWMRQQGDTGDATERSALLRQPAEKPWKNNGIYSQQITRNRTRPSD